MFVLSKESRSRILFLMGSFIALRLLTMSIIPLTDTTEARYAEIARRMLETDNWVTLFYDYGVPFWAKPPLSTWFSAFSMKVMGVTEFAARLPSLVIGLTLIGLLYRWIAKLRSPDQALVTAGVLLSMVLFVITIGTVMTDTCLLFACTLSMVTFWQAFHSEQRLWGYFFFISLGLGLLAKGPIAVALAGLPIGLWVLSQRSLIKTWKKLPWISGSVLMLAIALPWYLLAEQRTPGFLNYFIVGEHLSRFLVPGWRGDLYGHAHYEPIGMIWVYWLIAAAPWSFIAILGLFRTQFKVKLWLQDNDGYALYLLLWTITPLLFFTFARNIILTYPLTSLPAFAVLLVEAWHRVRDKKAFFLSRGYLALTMAPIILIAFTTLFIDFYPAEINKRSQKALAEYYLETRPSVKSQLLFLNKRFYSADFYTQGIAKTAKLPENIQGLLENNTQDYLAVPLDSASKFPDRLQPYFELCDIFGSVALYKERPFTDAGRNIDLREP